MYACRAQSFRELGNAFALLRMIDATVGTQNALESHFAAPFVGGVNSATGGAVKFSTHDTPLAAGVHALASGTMGYGAADGAAGAHARVAPAAGLLAEMSVLGAGSIFQAALQETETMLRELGLLDVWRGDEQTSTNPVLEVDETVEFYRLWSALQVRRRQQQQQPACASDLRPPPPAPPLPSPSADSLATPRPPPRPAD